MTNQKLNHSKSAFILSNEGFASFLNEGTSNPLFHNNFPFLLEKGNNLLFQEAVELDLFFKKFINLLMIDGKKIKASNIVFKMLTILKNRLKKDYEKKKTFITIKKDLFIQKSNLKDILINCALFSLIFKALNNVIPNLEVRKVRVAGSTYIVPAILSKKKQETLALKWIIESAKKRQKNSKIDFSTCLADEILDASRKLGHTRQKRDELHRLAQMNRAYIRYRWW